MNGDESARTPLTGGAYSWTSRPTWSPDGRKIAFAAQDKHPNVDVTSSLP